MTANWPIPELMSASRSTATRVTRRDLFEQLQPFPAQAVFELKKAGDVTDRLRQAVDVTGADRVSHLHEYDRNGAGRLQQGRQARSPGTKEDVRCERGQFAHMPANFSGASLTPPDVDPQVAALAPAQLLQHLPESRDAGLLVLVLRRVHQHADAPHPLALLRARRERPRGRRPAECGQQFPPSDSDCHTPLPCEAREGNDTTP